MGKKLEGKVAVVTGASSGIGTAAARALASEGARVALVARRRERLAELRELIQTDCLAVQADLREEREVARVIGEISSWAGRIDILVNNAGLSRGRPLGMSTDEDFRVMLDTNVLALANMCRLALPLLEKAEGYVVNISSIAAVLSSPGSAMYGASKAAVSAFSESLRKELIKSRVRVTSILPGFVDTEFFGHIPDEQVRSALGQMMASMEPLKAEDIAEAVMFAVTRPAHVSIGQMTIRPSLQEP